MKTIIAGSRSITDYDLIFKIISESPFSITKVISGTAKGVDQLGEKFAKEHGIDLELFPADWDKYGKKAGYLRNMEMAENADALIAIYDGKSKGTEHMINIAKRRGLPSFVYDINKPTFNLQLEYIE